MQTATQPKRRTHLNRRAIAKRIEITDNDISDIFEPLSRHKQLSTRQLVAFGSRHPTITKARLGELWHATQGERSHWLHRLNEEIKFVDHLFVEDLHRLGIEAEALLAMKGIVSAEPWVAASRIGGKSNAPSKIHRLAHDHMASNIVIDIEIGAHMNGGAYKSHLDILAASPESTRERKLPLRIPVKLDGEKTFIEPDALFAIRDRYFALEADRGSESIKTTIAHKIRAYREIVASGIIDETFGIDNLTVLFATTKLTRMKNFMRELEGIARNGKSVMFGFRAEDGFEDFMRSPTPTGRLFSASWQRVGHDDLILANAA